ncbi:Nce101p [Rhodotorula paludigena]|uniref:Nce101p n=1 Tax=Rhodotorula paludigena TaxID=86838 RepID=UPI00317DBF5A
MRQVYLISRWGDVLLALGTGCLAYKLYERRMHRPEGERLADLVQWKWAQRTERNPRVAAPPVASAAEQEGWEELERELKLKEQDAIKAGLKA